MAWSSVEVKRGAKVLQPATVLGVFAEDSFGSLLGRVCNKFQDETVEKVVISSPLNKGSTHVVPLGAPVVQV